MEAAGCHLQPLREPCLAPLPPPAFAYAPLPILSPAYREPTQAVAILAGYHKQPRTWRATFSSGRKPHDARARLWNTGQRLNLHARACTLAPLCLAYLVYAPARGVYAIPGVNAFLYAAPALLHSRFLDILPPHSTCCGSCTSCHPHLTASDIALWILGGICQPPVRLLIGRIW